MSTARAVPRTVLPPVQVPQVVDLRPVPKAPEPTPAPVLEQREVALGPLPDGRPRAPRREVKLAVPGYPGFHAWLWANYPQRIRLDLTSEDEARVGAALRRLVVEHDGWCDQDGEPYPAADEDGFWDAIPTELGTVLARLILLEAPAAYPKSLQTPAGS